MWTELLNTLVAIATLVGALAALFTLLAAVTRRTRLRRNAELWLQSMEASTGERRQLMADLHTNAQAHLVSYELVPGRRTYLAWLATLVGSALFGMHGWNLGESLLDHPRDSWWGHVSRVLGTYYLDTASSFIAGILLLSAGLMWIAAVIVARRHTAASFIDEQFPILSVIPGTDPGSYMHAHVAATISLARVQGRAVLIALCGAVLSTGFGMGIVVLRRGPLDPTSQIIFVLILVWAVAAMGFFPLCKRT